MNWRAILFLTFIAAAAGGAWWYWENERQSEAVTVPYSVVFKQNPQLSTGAAVASRGFPVGSIGKADLTDGGAVMLEIHISTNYTRLMTDQVYIVADSDMLHIETISEVKGQVLTSGSRLPGFTSRLKASSWKTTQWIKTQYENTRDYADDLYKEHFGESKEDQG